MVSEAVRKAWAIEPPGELERLVEERTAQLAASEKRLRMLLEITRAVSAHLEHGALFRTLAEAARGVISFDRMAILLAEDGGRELSLYAWENGDDRPFGQGDARFPAAGSLTGWVIEHRLPRLVSSLEDVRRFPVSYDTLARQGMRSACVLPLVLDDRALGALLFLGKRERLFDGVDLPLLREASAAMAVALDHCLAYEEITRLKDELEDEPSLMTLDEVQRRYITDVLDRVGWRVSGKQGAAEILGLKPTTLESRMKKLGIERRR